MNLPFSANLPTNKLASSFANTSATYKFYWLMAIIELFENSQTSIQKRDIFSRMISNSWLASPLAALMFILYFIVASEYSIWYNFNVNQHSDKFD